MTPNSTVLTSSVTPSSSIFVFTASGAFVPAHQVGSVTRSSDPSGRLSLDAVYHALQLSLSFLSDLFMPMHSDAKMKRTTTKSERGIPPNASQYFGEAINSECQLIRRGFLITPVIVFIN
ncbi:hypothetical protein U1Q18_017815 [Sarracenia purpurea var. burkii]